ncbi:unnamed protein product [Ilex paraguariensis]|uniref:Exostosin GT47 domain-containing protein n=1 Tax=Ilex paraguariensis TaxID=185542 RepID=A0ABC8RRW6_9AQUA
MDSLPTKSDVIGHIGGQPTSKVVDVLGTQEKIVVMDSKIIQSGNVAESDGQYSNLPLYNLKRSSRQSRIDSSVFDITVKWQLDLGLMLQVACRITWDFRRGINEDSGWGNKLMLFPEDKNMTILTIESSPWNSNDFAIPYPTYFHPSSDNEAQFKSVSIVIMAPFFSLTTPMEIVIGIGISSVYTENSSTTLIVEGLFNSVSAGILIYMALVDLLAVDFMNPRMQSNGKLLLGANISLLLGIGCVSVLAKWA